MTGFTFDNDTPYVMPGHFGPTDDGWDGRVAHYGDNTTLTVSFVTETEAVSAMLPRGFVSADPAIISVSFVECRDVDFMAGGGYNLVAVNAAARFEGSTDRAEGNFALVLWENEFQPIMLGREILGAPKLFADIPDAWDRDGRRGFEVFEKGTPLVSGEIRDARELSPGEIQAIVKQNEGRIWMGWKHIPACDFRGADLSYATALPFNAEIKEARAGSGEVTFHAAAWEEAPISHRAATALSRLPVLDACGALMTRGTKQLLIAEQHAMT